MASESTKNALDLWLAFGPTLITVGGGTFLGGLVLAIRKERSDKRLAIANRKRDFYVARADTLRRLIAALVGARSAASSGRIAISNCNLTSDNNRQYYFYQLHEKHVNIFQERSSEVLIEAERYGQIPRWSNLPDRNLSTYVNYVVHTLSFALDADSYEHVEFGDSYQHVSAMIVDLRKLVDVEEVLAHDVFANKRNREFIVPILEYCNRLKPYFDGKDIDVMSLDTWQLEEQAWEIEHLEDENRLRAEETQTVFESSKDSENRAVMPTSY